MAEGLGLRWLMAANPVARDDSSYHTALNTDLVVGTSSVHLLANGLDIDSTSFATSIVSGPASGSLVSFGTNGTFTYRPNLGFVGVDTFTSKLNDGSLDSNIATVSIAIGVPLLAKQSLDSNLRMMQPEKKGVRNRLLTKKGSFYYNLETGRPKRAAIGGLVYHVLNRANARMTTFCKQDDYEALEDRKRFVTPLSPARITRRLILMAGTSMCLASLCRQCRANQKNCDIILNKYDPDSKLGPMVKLKLMGGEVICFLNLLSYRSYIDKEKLLQLLPNFKKPETVNDLEYYRRLSLQTDRGDIVLDPLFIGNKEPFSGDSAVANGYISLSAFWDYAFCFDGSEFSLRIDCDFGDYDEAHRMVKPSPRLNAFEVDIFPSEKTVCSLHSTRRVGVLLSNKLFERAILEGLITGLSAEETDSLNGRKKVRTGILKRVTLFGREFFDQVVSETGEDENGIGLQLMTRFKFALQLSRGAIAVTYIDPPYERR